MNKLYAIIPCYNEENNIDALIKKWINITDFLKQFSIDCLEIVLINDGSNDNTKKIIESKMKKYPQITLIEHGINKGLGETLKTGLKYVVNKSNDNDFICTMDGDNTHDPLYLVNMFNKVINLKADCIIASRYCKTSKIKGVPFYRNFMSFGAKLFFSIILHIPNVKDYTCGYRLYSSKILKKSFEKYGEKIITEKGFTCMVELLYKLYKSGCIFEEAPFTLNYDKKIGQSKMKVLKNAIKSITIGIKLRLNY
ncbi:glycosyltransferase family 2 protein [Caloranaerobacter sp. DY30410]|uniref:glycosyltransferase family 2 protein n=1 Tax=Caloranaerobacter sp. DY30410 TaxID=3238305 RepID=UPI003CFEB774